MKRGKGCTVAILEAPGEACNGVTQYLRPINEYLRPINEYLRPINDVLQQAQRCRGELGKSPEHSA